MRDSRIDPRAIDKVSGKAWEALKPSFIEISEALLAVSPNVTGELTTIYVKYASPETDNQPFGVVWLKKSTLITLGLSLPEGHDDSRLVDAPKGCTYAGLTKYVVVDADNPMPDQLGDWVQLAYETRIKDRDG